MTMNTTRIFGAPVELSFNFPSYSTLPDTTQPDWDHDPLTMHRVGDRGQHLLFVAVRHSTAAESGNPHYCAVRAGLNLFVKVTNGEPAVVVVEGGLRAPGVAAEESYQLGGEGTLAAFYAKRHGFEQLCFEPPGQGRKQVRARGFSNEEFDAYLLGRFVPTYWVRGRIQSFDDFMHDRLTGSGDLVFDWGGPAPSYDYLVANWEDMYKKPFTPDDPQTLSLSLRASILL